MSKTMVMDYECQKKQFTEVDDNFDKGVIAIAYPGKNRNRSNISKASFEKALPSLKNKPIVGRFIPEENDFGGHDVDLAVDPETNETDLVNVTVPFGVVPESAKQYWETITEEDGTEREYLFTEALFWKRQYGYKTLKQKKRLHQSMEINVFEYNIGDDGYCNIEDFEWSALCILGDNVEPCFESASVQLFSVQNNAVYSTQFAQMLKDLEALSKTITFTEGGNDNTMDTITEATETIEVAATEFETTEEIVESTATVETEPTSTDASESNSTEVEDSAVVVDEPSEEGAADDDTVVASTETEESGEADEAPQFVKKFELPHDELRHKIYEALAPFEASTGDWYLIESVYDQYVIVHVTTYSETVCTTKYMKWEYTKDDNGVTLMGTPVEVYGQWLTAEERDALEQLRSDYNTVVAENETLLAYKAETEAVQINAQKDELYAQWAPLIGVESDSYKDLLTKRDEFTVDQLSMALKIAYADLNAKFTQKSKTTDNVTLARVSVSTQHEDLPYGGLFEKHGFVPQK